MRAFVSFFLVALLVTCPSFCRGVEVACCAGPEAECCPNELGRGAPAPPLDDDGCMCSGTALKADCSQASQESPLRASPLFGSFAETLRPVSISFGHGDHVVDRDGWLRPLRLHALLQLFLC